MSSSIFFNEYFAIHGNNQFSRLGRPASSGRVMLHSKHAADLFAMVEQIEKSDLTVRVIK